MHALFDCPGIDRWQALLDHVVAADERERLERHLESCPACQDQLERTEEGEETLRRLGRQVGDPTTTVPDRALTQILRLLHDEKVLDRPTPADPADLYYLRPSDRPDLLGLLGDYEVQAVIGQGGMGVVLKAFEPALHRLVAIKVLAAAIAGSATARRRFTREAQAAAAVVHEHVVAVHGVHETGGLPYLVMQFIAGESLQERLDRVGPLPVEEIVRIGLQTASGLAAAHAQGLIHRDIKPANLLLEGEPRHKPGAEATGPAARPVAGAPGLCPGEPAASPPRTWGETAIGVTRVKITDFGLARMVDDVGLTQSGVVAGTPEYMAPEQARAEPVDHRSDLFSLGSVLYACCTGQPPFRATGAVAVLRLVSDQQPRPIRSVNPEVPAWLEALIARLMAKEPADRFQTAAEVAGLLEGYLAHLRQPVTIAAPSLPPDPGECVEPTPRTARRLRHLLAVTAALVLLSLLGLGLSFHLAGPPGVQAPPAEGNRGAERPPRADYPEDFHPPLQGNAGEVPGLRIFGPEPGDCVTFKPDGLHVSLPPTYPRERAGTGVVTDFGIKGDFEITVSYEILNEPPPYRDGPNSTEFQLVVVPNDHPRAGTWHRTNQNRAILARQTTTFARATVPVPPQDQPRVEIAPLPMVATGHFLADFVRWNNEDVPRDPWGNEQFHRIEVRNPVRSGATAKAGRLRLVRSGPTLAFCVSEAPRQEFNLLKTAEFGTTDLKNVRILGRTGWEGKVLDVRVTDVRIRAQAFVKAGAEGPVLALDKAGPRPAPEPRERRWLTAVLVLSALSVAIAVSLGAWQYVRTRRRRAAAARPAPAPATAAAPAIAFTCSGCGKRLRAREEQAGRKLRCPQCQQGVCVPEARPRKPEDLS